jgi:redox-sensitive bicupin YhaK (pirin superfamily)
MLETRGSRSMKQSASSDPKPNDTARSSIMTSRDRSSTVRRSREVERQVTGRATSDGAGVRLTRVLTQDLQRRLDPFLLLDAFRSDDPEDYIGGFPNHPHRGFETVTYMLAGRIRHRDSGGHEGLVSAGGVQWMTAARGVVHSEMPEQENGLMQGFQLWLNLPASEKMSAPTYRDISAAEIPVFTDAEGVRVKVIAGDARGVAGAVSKRVTEPVFLDLELPAGRGYAASLPAGHNAFVYVYDGALEVGERRVVVPKGRMGILTTDPAADGVVLAAAEPSRALLLAGAPLHEPLVQYGPFVMNTAGEIRQALEDAAAGRLGAAPTSNQAAKESIE